MTSLRIWPPDPDEFARRLDAAIRRLRDPQLRIDLYPRREDPR